MDKKVNPVANNIDYLIASYKKALQLNKYVHAFEESDEDEGQNGPYSKSKTMQGFDEVETTGAKVQDFTNLNDIVATSRSKVAKYRDFEKHHFQPWMKPYSDLIN